MRLRSLFAALLLTVLNAPLWPHVCLAQTKDKAPETSSNDAFKPKSLAKLAVIVSADDKSRSPSFGSAMGNPGDQNRLVEDIFVQTLLQKGHTVVARSDLKSVLKEHALAASGLTDSNAAAVGKLLNVPAVLVIRITEYNAEIQRDGKKNSRVLIARASLGAKLIDVATGGILWLGNHASSSDVDGKIELVMVLSKVAERLSRAFPDKDTAHPVVFDPKDVSKLALVMAVESRGRMGFTAPDSRRGNDDQQRMVEDKLSVQLGNKGYSLVSRTDLQSVMQEKQFQDSGLTEENVSQFGKLLNVPVVLVVRITECEIESRNRGNLGVGALGARLISVETGQVLWCRTRIESQEIGGKLDLPQVLAKASKKIGDGFPDKKAGK